MEGKFSTTSCNLRRTVQCSGTALLGALLFLRHLYKRSQSRPRGVAFVPGHWLLGNLVEFVRAVSKKSQHDLVDRWHELHGDTIVVSFPAQPPLIDTIDPRNVEHILKLKFDNYVKGNWFRDRLVDLLGDGIFNVDGAAWFHQRKTASRMFTQNQFKTHIWRVVKRNCAKVVHLLRDSPPDTTVDMFNIMNRFTLDTIGEVGFAKSIGSLENADSPFLKSFDMAQQISVQRFYLPLWQIKRLFGLGDEGIARGHFKMLSAYSLETVQELRANMSGEQGDSFVGLFMREAEKNNKPYDGKFMQDLVLNFLIAGRDTTAQSLSWILYLVMEHREVESKILEEIDRVCEDRPILFDELNQLIYLQAVVNEGLRLYPSVPWDSKMALQDDLLPDGTFVPRNCVVQFNPYSMGRSKKIWGDDASEFRPERWIGKEMPSSYTFPVFNAGPRECLGKRLAWVEMKTCLAELLRAFHFELSVPCETIKKDVQLTIGMSSGLPCRVIPRRASA